MQEFKKGLLTPAACLFLGSEALLQNALAIPKMKKSNSEVFAFGTNIWNKDSEFVHQCNQYTCEVLFKIILI